MGEGLIMVIDDELGVREMLHRLISSFGFEVVCFADGREALKALRETPSSLSAVITDLKMEAMDGMEVLSAVKAIDPSMPVIMITAYATVESAVQAMKQGAYDYISKPFDADSIEVTIRKAVEHKRLLDENRRLRDEVADKYRLGNIIGKSPKMVAVYEMIQRVAPSDSTVLIQGESGTGKELVAKALHRYSHRAQGTLLSINCSAFPETLLESELFGYEKGAFTGATTRKKGIMETANGGTLFLDEIGEMPISLQSKLLRAIEEKEFLPVGGRTPIKVDVRIISATNKELNRTVEEGGFRADLYYRLNVVTINLPTLRERPEDIPLLAAHFLEKYSAKAGKKVDSVSQRVMKLFMSYPWPGNIRELENIIERAVIMTYGQTVDLSDLPENLQPAEAAPVIGNGSLPFREAKQQFERQYLIDLLRKHGGNITRAAQEAHLHRTHIHEKIKNYGIKEEEYS
jgi:DNA-binding NtrC family response regulator